MKNPRAALVLFLLLQLAGGWGATNSPDLAWPALSRENRPWTRWWWPGNGVDKTNLTQDLESMAANGLGGVEITPIYGAKDYEDHFISFLSPKYVEMLAHVGKEAKRLDLGVDMATGTGWPFGGPQVEPRDVELKVTFAADGALVPIPTGFKVKRAAPGGEGFVLNPYSVAAMTRYLATFTKALAALPAETITSQFHDSFEYQANWARELPGKFRALHGYDLCEHAAELDGRGDPDTVARIKADYRTTLGTLHLDYIRTWVNWAHARGEKARHQAHGSPGNLLDLYAAADIPETEIFGSLPYPIPGFRHEAAEIGPPGHLSIIHRFASSAAHVMGKPLVSSETFTWLREHFHESPSEMKPELDALFLAGINHVFYHGNAYSPADAPWPGWLFYASSQLNTRNPLWRDLGDGLNAYIARCQSLLQSGTPDNDLLVYWPSDDLWHNSEGQQIQLTIYANWLEKSSCGKLMTELSAKGWSYDLISDAQLSLTHVNPKGGLITPGSTYRSILVPGTTHMPLETLQRLLALAKEGAIVIFVDAPPSDVPGFSRLGERRALFKSELASLPFNSAHSGVTNVPCGKGKIVIAPLDAALVATNARLEAELTSAGIGVLRRRTSEGHLYFLANLTGKPFDGWATLARSAQSAVQMNPLNGRTGVAATRQLGGKISIYLQLAPGESVFIKTLTNRTAIGEPIIYHREDTSFALDGDWRITALRGGPELPASFTTRDLASWTSQGGEWERFGGTARYETELIAPEHITASDWLIDLGDVRETARVFVNGIETGLAWSLPMRMKIGAFLKPGKNTVTVEVTNLAANRIRDLDQRRVDWKKFHEINFVDIFYKPFDASRWPVQPSGLRGPIKLVPLRAFSP